MRKHLFTKLTLLVLVISGLWASAPPGRYSATLAKEVNGKIELLSSPIDFDVVPLP